ncbi:hypothetical protein RhiirC2_746600 [Rhizophagus irregularis]|uniref:Uncharacterized protein n=1 Tax=Rhizophagus irregularis TaxID=588596 RepID=A0A2N1N929_9GLOM|nr:hypothetical protein RhiirC2_746600 [Rhizophagus irregularis]
MPNPTFQRRMVHQRNSNNNSNNPNFSGSMQETVRVFASDEEPDATIEVPESSDSEVNVTTSIPAARIPWRPTRRHESRQDNNNTRDSHRSFNSRAALAAIAARSSASNDSPLTDEQMARRMQAYEYSTIDEHQTVLARLLAGAGRGMIRILEV